MQTIQIGLPKTLLERAQLKALDEARELITFLLEQYVQELEKAHRRQAFETYFTARSPEEEAEELEVLSDFAFAERRMVLLHGFVKKARRTPIRDIEIAERRLDDFVNRQGG